MKVKLSFLLVFLVALIAGCDNESKESENKSQSFEMRVDKVEKLEGVVLKGIAISGPVTGGCIKNNDEIVVGSDGEEALEEVARILKIQGTERIDPEAVEAVKGDYISLYIPDGSPDAVKHGDVVAGSDTSCE